MDSTTSDRSAGVLLGQACGDALGVPYEFQAPPGENELAEMRGGGLGPYQPGEWSDDTQMALCIARVAARGVDLTSEEALNEIADAFLDWGAHGASDIGNQTRAVLSAARRSEGPAGRRLRNAAKEYASQNPLSAGNGALMRTSVVGLTSLDDRDATAKAARAVAELTHGDPLAAESCVLWSEAVRVAVTEGRFELLAGLDLLAADRRDQWRDWIDQATDADPRQFTPNGYTVTALQAAWAAITSTPEPGLDPAAGSYPCLHLQHALHNAVRVGDDTDTVAAIAGGLLGARWGSSAVPWNWRRAVHGWPGMAVRELVSLGIVTASRGASGPNGWPMGERVESSLYDYTPHAAVRHPHDDGVWLGTVAASAHDADAVVSMCRLGAGQVPAAGVDLRDHVEAWLIDSDDPDKNLNLDFVLGTSPLPPPDSAPKAAACSCTALPHSSAHRPPPLPMRVGSAYPPTRGPRPSAEHCPALVVAVGCGTPRGRYPRPLPRTDSPVPIRELAGRPRSYRTATASARNAAAPTPTRLDRF